MGNAAIKPSFNTTKPLSLAVPKTLGFFQGVPQNQAETKPTDKPADKPNIKTLSSEQIRDQLNKKFVDGYLKNNFPGVNLPDNTTPMKQFAQNRERLIEKIEAYKTYDGLVAEKQNQLQGSFDPKIRTEVQKDILSNPLSPQTLKDRATWIPEGEKYAKQKLNGPDYFNGFFAGSISSLVSGLIALGLNKKLPMPMVAGAIIGAAVGTGLSYLNSQNKIASTDNDAKTKDAELNDLLQKDVDAVAENKSPEPVPTPTPVPRSSGGGGFCFVAGTKVTLKDGSYKAIEDVRVGDEVTSYDEVKKITYASPVVEVLHHEAKPQTLHHFTLSDGTTFTSNDIHPIYVQNLNSYLPASALNDRLKANQQSLLQNDKGQTVSVSKIDLEQKTVPVYNLHVQGVSDTDPYWKHGIGHNYYANGILAHNAK